MKIDEFIKVVEEEFEDIDPGTLNPENKLRSIEGWDSMHALLLIARIESEWDVTITAEQLKKTNTIEELYQLVQTRQN